jgi:hypothetical protein
VGVADVVSRLRLFAADSADLCHDYCLLRSNSEGLTAKGNFGAWCVNTDFTGQVALSTTRARARANPRRMSAI